jgi:RNA polymerase sigma factor (sigma-70 family)
MSTRPIAIAPPAATRACGFSELYASHGSWLESWLRRRLGNRHDAADLAHDTFLRILARRDVDAIEQPRAYLATVARGLMVNWCQRQALERAYLEALSAQPEGSAPSPEQRLAVLQSLQSIDAALDQMPGVVRRTFLLAQLDGLKYEDIARELKLSLSTVKRHMKAAFVQCLMLMD